MKVLVVLSTTEVGSFSRLCWKSCRTYKRENRENGKEFSLSQSTKLSNRTLEETPEEVDVELIVSVRLCPRAAAGSEEFGSLEIIDSAEEEPGAVTTPAADVEDEDTGAGGWGRAEEDDCCSSAGVVLVTRATDPRLEGAVAESREPQLLSWASSR